MCIEKEFQTDAMKHVAKRHSSILSFGLLLFSKLCDHHRQNSQLVVCSGLPSIKQNLYFEYALVSKIVFWIKRFQSDILNNLSLKCDWSELEHSHPSIEFLLE